MKKILIFVLISIMTVSLAGCGKSKAAIAAEEAISAIGTVTLDSETLITEAEKLYGILTEDEKETVENRIELVNAREQYDALVLAQIEAEEKARAEAELAKITAALPEARKLLDALLVAVDNLEFIAKYAGNTNGKGERGFADSFIDGMFTTFDNIDMDVLNEALPDFTAPAYDIQTNYYNIGNMLIEMGITNSASNVPTIKQTSLDTIDMISTFLNEQSEYINSLLNEAGIQ